MDRDEIAEDIIIKNIQFEDVYEEGKNGKDIFIDWIRDGYIKIDLYGLRLVRKDFLIGEWVVEKNFVHCEEDQFLEYALNLKNDISAERKEVMRQEYYHIPHNFAYKLVCQRSIVSLSLEPKLKG